ncbi:MAG: fibronectin type III domain-containing protein [Actinomycetota bacterium]|nr:fibronectin type III domain-containing protein [Actinomycetota bacterium]
MMMPEEVLELRPGEEVACKIRGWNGAVYGPWSDLIIITAISDTSSPGKPTDLSLAGIHEGLVASWANPVDRDLKHAFVYVSGSTIPVDGEGRVTGLEPAAAVDADYCVVGDLTAGATYYVRVEAVDNAGNRSVASDEDNVAIPSDVDIPGVYKVSGTQVVGARQSAISDAKTDYTTGDLDTEAEIIAALNATNGKINDILAALRSHGLIAT